jgi:hypothetical protein
MRFPIALVALAVVACAKSEQPAADTSAMTAGPAPATEADITGTWTGETKLAGTDSVVARFTAVCGGGNCTTTSQESADTVRFAYTLEADSIHFVTPAYADASMGGARVVQHTIARASGGSATGTGWTTLADKPDSVLVRTTFAATRK